MRPLLLVSTTFPSAAVYKAAELNPPSSRARIRRTNYFPRKWSRVPGLVSPGQGRIGLSGTGRWEGQMSQLADGQAKLLLDELQPVEVRELPEDLAVLVRASTN